MSTKKNYENYNDLFLRPLLRIIEEILDAFLALVSITALLVGIKLVSSGTTINQLFMIDISGIPWGDLWELIKAIGTGGALTRTAVWLWEKFGGNKYAIAIWYALESAPLSEITKEEVKKETRLTINDWRGDKFAKAWMDMRKKGTIIKVGTDDKEKNLYKLSIDQE